MISDIDISNNSSDEGKSSFTEEDRYFMQIALSLAKQGAEHGEVPVGAVLVEKKESGIQIIGQGFNQPIRNTDPTAHAEIVALRNACMHLNNYRLSANTTLYVTLEPCTMCVGALIHARLNKLIFATAEPRAGMVGSQDNLLSKDFYNHHCIVQSGLCIDESRQLLKDFFRQRRQLKSKNSD